ncbi:MAG: hypothetical protein KGK33_08940 [Hyphomicrobiales bacterium]|nr:hypothetical protein [Hyphomicrobiales bacterium]
MARNRKPHPADLANANIVAEAVRFDIALFLGVGRYATDTAETIEEALAKADHLVAMHPNGRRPLVYGVTTDGRSGLVTNAMLSNMEDLMKTKAKKKATAKRASKPAATKKAPKAAAKQEPVSTRSLGKRAAIEAAAREGKLPEPPDFSAETHKRFRNKLASVVDLAKAGNLKALRAFEINPVSSSPKAIARYRDLCVIALEAQTAR